ncbi:MAG: SDR family NAD(P)-dependent oxidoreductase [Propionibacteriaceae bacterium]|nr:SDR family NAD(P)-dependent oxidoreductase [Propionibacteriaceae bacterium]
MSANTVLITGGATGIGVAMAAWFLAHGNRVAICGRRQDRLDQAADQHPGLMVHACDVTDPDSRRDLLSWAGGAIPDMNILVNNAGIQRDIDLTAGVDALEAGESEIAVNLEAPVWLSALFLPMLVGKDNATIISVSSGLAFMVERASRAPVYCATKAGLHAFCVAQRIQLAPVGVRVVEIIPPAVESELNMESRAKRNLANASWMMGADQFVEQAMAQVADDQDEIRVGVPGRGGTPRASA